MERIRFKVSSALVIVGLRIVVSERALKVGSGDERLVHHLSEAPGTSVRDAVELEADVARWRIRGAGDGAAKRRRHGRGGTAFVSPPRRSGLFQTSHCFTFGRENSRGSESSRAHGRLSRAVAALRSAVPVKRTVPPLLAAATDRFRRAPVPFDLLGS